MPRGWVFTKLWDDPKNMIKSWFEMDWLGSLKSEGCGEKGSFPYLRTEL